MLNRHLPDVCENMIEMNAIIEKAIEKGYISELELKTLKQSYDIYIRSFFCYIELAELDNYLAPENPHFNSADDTWLELLKEIRKLNREKL